MSELCNCVNSLQHQSDSRIKHEFLRKAARNVHPQCVQILLEDGARPEHQEKPSVLIDMLGPLKYQKSNPKYLQCAHLLVQAGAKVDLSIEEHTDIVDSLFQNASMQKLSPVDEKLVHLLLTVNEGPDPIEHTDDWGRSWLCSAASVNNIKLVKRFLAMGIDPNFWDVNNPYPQIWFPLNIAAHVGNEEIVQLLIHAGASLNEGALAAAVYKGNAHCAKLLIDAGATFDFCEWHRLPSSLDATSNRPWNLLIDSGVMVTQPIAHALFDLGVKKMHLDLIDTLLKAGLDPQLYNTTKNILEMNMSTNLMVCSLVNTFHGGCWEKAFETVVQHGTEKDVDLLVECGSTDINAPSFSSGGTAIHLASSVSVAKGLLKHGACINAQNNDGETSLMINASTYFGDDIAPVISYLIGQGADVNIRDKFGQTALMLSCKYFGSHLNVEGVHFLQAGAVINVENCDGKNALGLMETKDMGILKKAFFRIMLIAGEKDTRCQLNDLGDMVILDETFQEQICLYEDDEDEEKENDCTHHFGPLSLKSLCRNKVRHCLSKSGSVNLFASLPQLAQLPLKKEKVADGHENSKRMKIEVADYQTPYLPAALIPYLLYDECLSYWIPN